MFFHKTETGKACPKPGPAILFSLSVQKLFALRITAINFMEDKGQSSLQTSEP